MPRPLTYTVELRPPAGDAQPHLRLKRALKCLWRSFGLKCVAVSELPSGDRPAETEPPRDDEAAVRRWLEDAKPPPPTEHVALWGPGVPKREGAADAR